MKTSSSNTEMPDFSENQISRQPPVYYAKYTLSASVKTFSGTVISTTTKGIEIYGYPWCFDPFRDFGAPNQPGNTGNEATKVYPNPTGDILNIEIEAENTKTNPTYHIRLYDGQSILQRQQKTKGGTVQFNVANLPNGTYYLHIYDGVSETPEMRQIVVEH